MVLPPPGSAAARDLAAAPPSLHGLLSGVQTGPTALVAAVVEVAAVAAYLLAVRRRPASGAPWPRWATACWVAGMAVTWVALGSGLAAYDDTSVPAHAVQHVLLMMVAGPLLALGRPVTLAIQAAPRPAQRRLVACVRSGPVRGLSHPVVGAALYYGTMAAMFLTPLYGASERSNPVHEAVHALSLAAGYLYWEQLLGADPLPRRPSHGVRIAAALAGSPLEAAIGIVLAVRSTPVWAGATVAGTQAGGHLFIITSMLATGVWVMVLVGQWMRRATLEAPREDRRAAALAAASAERAAALGLEPVPAGWTVPEWRLGRPGPPER